jgi:hypothetical protein
MWRSKGLIFVKNKNPNLFLNWDVLIFIKMNQLHSQIIGIAIFMSVGISAVAVIVSVIYNSV